MARFDLTYETITDESAEHGEAAESGYEAEQVSLREAHDVLRWHGGHCEASDYPVTNPRWLTFFGETDYQTGETKNLSLHIPDTVTPSSKRRICKLFDCYGF